MNINLSLPSSKCPLSNKHLSAMFLVSTPLDLLPNLPLVTCTKSSKVQTGII